MKNEFVQLVEKTLNNDYHFVGTCINSFDEDGNCSLDIFSDTTDFAQQEENAQEITKQQFLSKVKNIEMLPRNEMKYLYIKDRDVLMAYDIEEDIHYFFSR